ncbi:MAG: hypothetical protein AABW79_01195 [Nanoarchaeota archaeon]
MMGAGHFRNQVISIKQKFKDRKKLLRPIIKFHGAPVLVHSIYNRDVFNQILQDGKLKLPNDHFSFKKTPLMEKILKTDNCLYYSLGFVYFTSYRWKYNLLFDLDYLKNLVYYRKGMHFKAYRLIVDYWYENDRPYLEKLANTSPTARAVIDRYYYEPYNGKVRKILEFWKIEKELFDYFSKYLNKNKLVALIRETAKQNILQYPFSKRYALRFYFADWSPEIVGKKENNLLKNPYFLGFFIDGSLDRKTLTRLKQKYSDKIIFDGKKIRKIGDL